VAEGGGLELFALALPTRGGWIAARSPERVRVAGSEAAIIGTLKDS
jgi:hypothetical protein